MSTDDDETVRFHQGPKPYLRRNKRSRTAAGIRQHRFYASTYLTTDVDGRSVIACGDRWTLGADDPSRYLARAACPTRDARPDRAIWRLLLCPHPASTLGQPTPPELAHRWSDARVADSTKMVFLVLRTSPPTLHDRPRPCTTIIARHRATNSPLPTAKQPASLHAARAPDALRPYHTRPAGRAAPRLRARAGRSLSATCVPGKVVVPCTVGSTLHAVFSTRPGFGDLLG